MVDKEYCLSFQTIDWGCIKESLSDASRSPGRLRDAGVPTGEAPHLKWGNSGMGLHIEWMLLNATRQELNRCWKKVLRLSYIIMRGINCIMWDYLLFRPLWFAAVESIALFSLLVAHLHLVRTQEINTHNLTNNDRTTISRTRHQFHNKTGYNFTIIPITPKQDWISNTFLVDPTWTRELSRDILIIACNPPVLYVWSAS